MTLARTLVKSVLLFILFLATNAQGNEEEEAEEKRLEVCPGFVEYKIQSEAEAAANKINLGDDQSPLKPETASELLRLVERDQTLRRRWIADPENNGWERSIRLHEAYATFRLKELSETDLPTVAEVGAEGMKAAWLLIQHSIDLSFQKKALAAFRKRSVPGISTASMAMLEDRIRVTEGKPQRFGSQFYQVGDKWFPYRIANKTELASLRAKARLMPFGTYECVIKTVHSPPASDTAVPGK